MSCPECERRSKDERKSLDDCNSSLETLKVKCHRLTVALSVVSAVAGKEALDMAFSLTDSIAAVIQDEGSSGSTELGLDLSVEDAGSLVRTEAISELEQVDDLFFGVNGDEVTASIPSQTEISVIEVFEEVQPLVLASGSSDGFIYLSKPLHSDHTTPPFTTEFSVIPTPTSLPLLALLAIKGKSRARST